MSKYIISDLNFQFSKYLISGLNFQFFHVYMKKSSNRSLKTGFQNVQIYLSSIKTTAAINILKKTFVFGKNQPGCEKVKQFSL